MQLLVRYTRIYALGQTGPTTPRSHLTSPIQIADFPLHGTRTDIHVGAVPGDVLQALKFHRAWIRHAFRGGFGSADELRVRAADIPEQEVLNDPRNLQSAADRVHWYVTLCIEDHVELPEDITQPLLGVDGSSWIGLDNPEFFGRHTETLDQLSVRTAITVAPYRYRWQVWDGPLVYLPTDICLRPPQIRGGRVRVITGPALEKLDLSALQSTGPETTLHSLPMTVHFYLRATTGTDPIVRFFDAFRALEGLCARLEDSVRAGASAHCANGTAAAQDKSLTAFQHSQATVRRRFATMALALNPTGADADLDKFNKLYQWRNDLVHGNRKLEPDEAPDEETFELLHRYLAELS